MHQLYASFAKACSMLARHEGCALRAQSLNFPDIVLTLSTRAWCLPGPDVYLSRVTYDGDRKGTVQLRGGRSKLQLARARL